MNFPTPPSNPITDTVTHAAAQVVDAATAVVEAVTEATEQAIGTATSNGVAILRQGLDAPVAGEIMDRTASVVSGVRAVVDQAVGSTVGTAVQVVTAAVGVATLALGSAVAAGSAAVRTAQAAGALGIAIAEFVARSERNRARQAMTETSKQWSKLQGDSAELLRLAKHQHDREAQQDRNRMNQEVHTRRNVRTNFERTLEALIGLATGVLADPGSGTPAPAPASGVRRLEQAAAKLELHLVRRGYPAHQQVAGMRGWMAQVRRPQLQTRAGLILSVR